MYRVDEPGMTVQPAPSNVVVQPPSPTMEPTREEYSTPTPSPSGTRLPNFFSVTHESATTAVDNDMKEMAKTITPMDGMDDSTLQPSVPVHNDTNKVSIKRQQQLLTDWLHNMLAKEKNVLKRTVIVYKVHPQSGIGNMIRGLLTTMLFSVALKKSVTSSYTSSSLSIVHSYDNFYCHFFFPPFPNMCNMKRCESLITSLTARPPAEEHGLLLHPFSQEQELFLQNPRFYLLSFFLLRA